MTLLRTTATFLLPRPSLRIPRGALRGRVVLHALDPSLEDEVSRLLVQRDGRDVVRHQRVGLVEQRKTLLDVQLDVGLLEQTRRLAVAVLHVVLVAVALPDFYGACNRKASSLLEKTDVELNVKKR